MAIYANTWSEDVREDRSDGGGFKGAKRNKRERLRGWSREWRSRKRGSWSSFMQMKESDKMKRGRMHARKNERNTFYRNQKVVRVIATHRPTGPAPMGGLRARNVHPWGTKLRARLRRIAWRITSLEHAKTLNTIEITPISSRLSAYWW